MRGRRIAMEGGHPAGPGLRGWPRALTAGLLGLALAGCSGAETGSATGSAEAVPTLASAPVLGDARSWTYQLQGYPDRLGEVGRSGFDVAVVDYSADGTRAGKWTPGEVAAAGQNKLLIAYLSIGEAENYRSYWGSGWKTGSPAFVGGENPDWPGNYLVHYWDPAWQTLVLAYLDELIDQGFDGAYLDVVDGYQAYPDRPTARREMVDLVCRISQHAKARRPGFAIVPQNASELIWEPGYAGCVDGTGQEETFFAATDEPTDAEHRAGQLGDYAEFRRLGKAVLLVDYADESAHVGEAYRLARQAGLVPYVTGVELDRLRVNPGLDPTR